MPPKRKPTGKAKKLTVCTARAAAAMGGVSECCVCSNYIVDGEDDALFCEGECNGWMHRYCAGIPVKHFENLTSTSIPFLCYSCTLQTHERVTAELKEQVKSLAAELEDLRKSIIQVGVTRKDRATGAKM